MNRYRSFLAFFVSLTALLWSGASLAGAPAQISRRTLAPVHAFEPAAARGEVSEIRKALAVAKSKSAGVPAPPAPKPNAVPAGDRVRNAYLLRSPDSAVTKMASRLEGKNPLVLSAAQFEKSAGVLPRAGEGGPAAVASARVYRDSGLIEMRLGDRTEMMTLELSPGVVVDEAGLSRSIGQARKLLFQGTRRPDTIVQRPDGTFVIKAGAVQILDPRAERLRVEKDRRLVRRLLPRGVQKKLSRRSGVTLRGS